MTIAVLILHRYCLDEKIIQVLGYRWGPNKRIGAPPLHWACRNRICLGIVGFRMATEKASDGSVPKISIREKELRPGVTREVVRLRVKEYIQIVALHHEMQITR